MGALAQRDREHVPHVPSDLERRRDAGDPRSQLWVAGRLRAVCGLRHAERQLAARGVFVLLRLLGVAGRV